MRLIGMEFFKCRRRQVPLICLALIAAQLLWMGVSISRMELEEMSDGWKLLLHSLTVIDAVMLPLTVAAIASRSCELEHRGHTLKLLETVRTPGALFDAKLAWGAVWIALLLLGREIVLTVYCLCTGFPLSVPWGRLALHLLFSFAVSLTIYVLQESLSLLFANQAVALVAGIFGSFVGLFTLFFPPAVQRLVLWSYYGVLALTVQDWNAATRVTHFYWLEPNWPGLGLLAVWFLLLLAVGRSLFVRKEV